MIPCSRCGEDRWPAGSPAEPYVCQRCREVLAGGNAIDPLPSPAQLLARKAAGERLRPFRVVAPSQTQERPAPAEVPQSDPAPVRRQVVVRRRMVVMAAAGRDCRCQRGCCSICGPERLVELEAPTDSWLAVRAQVLQRDGRRCRRCDAKHHLTAHHIRPRAMGGIDALDNLITLCEACHDWAEIETEALDRPMNIAELTCPPELES